MSVPPLRLSDNFNSYISGEVIIHPSAVIAPGVILQAGQKSKIIISSGVCIGTGSILQVHEGTLEIGANANLGAGFLMVGPGKVGENACIGSATTIFNGFVPPGEVVPPGSILGENSREVILEQNILEQNILEQNILEQGTLEQDIWEQDIWEQDILEQNILEQNIVKQIISPDPVTIEATDSPSAFVDNKLPETEEKVIGEEGQNSSTTTNSSVESKEEPQTQTETEKVQELFVSSETANNTETNNIGAKNNGSNLKNSNIGGHIYGQRNIQHLLVTLFPHRHTLNQPPTDEESK
jgi:carbon dioxide concentrating mechanism protein CcmN